MQGGRSELAQALWSFRREFVMVGVFSMVSNMLMLSPTLYMLQYDRVLASRSELTLLAVSLVTLFLFGVMAFAEWMRSRVLVRSGLRMDAMLSTRVFNASFDASLSQSGSTVPRAFNDLLQIRQFLTGNGIFAFFDAPWAPIYIAVLFFLHPLLGWVSILFALVQAGLAWFGHRRTVQPTEAASSAGAESSAYLQGKLRNAEALESMGMVDNLRPHWLRRHRAAVALQSKASSLTHRITAWSKFIRYTQQSLALGAGALLVIDGQLTPGAMIAANVLMTRALAPIDMLVNTWKGFVMARGAYGRLEELLQQYPERDAALQRVAPRGVLQLRQLVATAPGRKAPILKGVDLAIEPGTVQVVLGPSGSGKSTLARTMIGIWPDVAGEVLLDGLPMQGWDRSELGPYIGYLPQDIELFEGSVAENIARFGEVDPEKVIAAAQAAGFHEMILRFRNGYASEMGEAGGLLSGGQRQRVALARAMYGNPVLVVLDEPNANLDDVGEAALVRAVLAMKQAGATVVLVTHRPGILAVADRLLILRNGQVQAEGPRDAVLQALRDAQAQAQARAAAGALAAAPAA
ncbi:MAG: type I secretion system permease/ATPase [Pseudorhodobacter sp.]|nr:MAG: type I secretion system permease/ATPase [Pseudorhodobacter sp.]